MQTIPGIPDISGSYIDLPTPNTRKAPPTFSGEPDELEPFLESFHRVCIKHNITSSQDQYKGLIQYCTPKLAKTLRSFPSHKEQSFDTLLEELDYFYGNKEPTYNVANVEAFSTKWRSRKITTLNQFVLYHRKYQELVGKAREEGWLSKWDYNRYFWEGLHRDLRRKIEDRMLAADPDLDIGVPFKLKEVASYANKILTPRRFDQHLIDHTVYHSSDTEPEEEPPKQRTRKEVFESESEDVITPAPKRQVKHKKQKKDESSDHDSDNSIQPLYTGKHKANTRTAPPVTPDRAKEEEEFKQLIKKMTAMDISDPEYRALYIETIHKNPEIKDGLRRPVSRPFNQPSYPPPQQFQRNIPPPPFRREQPPHSQPGGYSTPVQDRRDVYCFACGMRNHQMRDCRQLNGLLNQGTINKNPHSGRLEWPDGSRIMKDANETWIQAIEGTKQANFVRLSNHVHDPDSVYSYIGVDREEDDASTDEQEELGWSSGQVTDCQAFSAERAERVSKNARRKVQFNTPNIPQRMEKFPSSREDHCTGRKHFPPQKDVNLDSNQTRNAGRIMPIDTHKNKFEGKMDDQFLPMQTDQQIVAKSSDNPRKDPTHEQRPNIIKVTNPGSDKGKEISTITQGILDLPLTISVKEACSISPSLRRELGNAVKVTREVSPPTQEKMSLMGELASDESDCDHGEPDSYPAPAILDELMLGKSKDGLMKVPVRIGQVRMTGVYDTGAQVNLISRDLVEAAGLPWSRSKQSRTRLVGVDGKVTRCAGKVPMTKIIIGETELPTYGEIHVLPNPGVELLLGRTWQTLNLTGSNEEPSGSIVKFRSKGEEFRMNTNPNFRIDPHTNELRPRRPRRAFLAAIAGLADQEEEGSDSESANNGGKNRIDCAENSAPEIEEQENGLEYLPNPEFTDEYPTPAQRVREESMQHERPSEDKDRCWLAPASRPTKHRADALPSEQESSDEGSDDEDITPRERYKISSRLHERYISMVQNSATNEEWEAFCKDETRLLHKDKEEWERMNKSDSEENIDSENDHAYEQNSTRQPCNKDPEPSHTLATPDPTPTPKNPRRSLRIRNQSKVTTTRRSRRASRQTDRGENMERGRPTRRYERHERQTRKTIARDKGPATRSASKRAFVLRLASGDDDEDDTEEGTDDRDDDDEDASSSDAEPKETCKEVSSDQDSENEEELTVPQENSVEISTEEDSEPRTSMGAENSVPEATSGGSSPDNDDQTDKNSLDADDDHKYVYENEVSTSNLKYTGLKEPTLTSIPEYPEPDPDEPEESDNPDPTPNPHDEEPPSSEDEKETYEWDSISEVLAEDENKVLNSPEFTCYLNQSLSIDPLSQEHVRDTLGARASGNM